MTVTENLLDIDHYVLDEEWMNQPKLYFRYSAELTKAREEWDLLRNQLEVAKSELDDVMAELDLQIRNDPDGFGLTGKVTEASIKNTILLQEAYKTAKKECEGIQTKIIQAKSSIGVLEGFVEALSQRKTALENLVRLHGQNYFSTPRVSDDEDGKEFIHTALQRKARTKKERKD